MNNWLNRLERKYGRYGIPNLTNILVAGQILVLAIELFVDRTISFWLGLSRSLLLQGQVWRVISFIFIPFSGGSILSVVLGIYFTWFIGTALEREWGDFRYTVYLLSGVLGTVLGCLLTGVTASTYCLSLSLLLAFAMLYPEVQLLLFFVIPIRVKYFGVFAAVLWVFSFLGASLPGKLDYLLSMLNVGSFYISINSIGAASAKEFNPAIHIRRLNVNWTCGQRFGELLEEAEFNLVATRSAARAVVKALKAGKTTVDLTGATGGGEDAGGGSNPGGGSDGDQGENPLG